MSIRCFFSHWPQDRRRVKAFTLIELLVVIAIVAILAGILIPTITGAIDRAERTRALAEVKALELAFRNYFQEYSRWPTGLAGTVDTGNNVENTTIGGLRTLTNVVTLLSGIDVNNMNPRRIAFMEFPQDSLGTAGDFQDPWGNPYKYMLDFNYDNETRVRFTGTHDIMLRRPIAVWSGGKNEADLTPNGVFPSSW